jgi:glycosyltransferase involved in cell wall biosynthesis
MTTGGPRTVVHVHDRSHWGGNIEHIRLLCRGLDPAVWRTMVAGPPEAAWVRRLAAEGIPTLPSRIDGKWDVRAALRLARHLRDTRAAIVHTHIRRADLMGTVAARLARPTRAVVTLHGPICVDERGRDRIGFSERVYGAVLRRGADAVIAVSEATRQEAIQRLGCPPDHVFHVVNGTDLARFRAPADPAAARQAVGLRAGEVAIGMVSRFVAEGSYMKGHPTLLHAFARVAVAQPDAVLVLVGDGESRSAIAALADRLGVASRVRFLGERDDVPALLPAFAVVALPSRGEGLPRALVEAMAARVAVVGTRVGGIEELLAGGAGVLVERDDAGGLAAALTRLLSEPALRQHVASAGQLRAQQYSVVAMCRATEAIYRRVLENR